MIAVARMVGLKPGIAQSIIGWKNKLELGFPDWMKDLSIENRVFACSLT